MFGFGLKLLLQFFFLHSVSPPLRQTHLNRSEPVCVCVCVIFCSYFSIRLMPQATHNHFLLHDTCTCTICIQYYIYSPPAHRKKNLYLYLFFLVLSLSLRHVIRNFESSFQLSGCTNNRPKMVLIFNLNMK